MCYFPKDDFIYDHSKSRAENYQRLLKSVEEDANSNSLNNSWKNRATDFLNNRRRWYKGAHLDWNYTEMIRDLIDQGLVKLPISDVEVIFVEWAAGNLDNVEREFKYDKAWFDWDGKRWPGCNNEGKHGWSLWWNKRYDLAEAHAYNDSNREEYTPILQLPASKYLPQEIEYGNYADPNFIPWQEREYTAFWVMGIAE